ncbi:hypothetical protein N431DRAFT_371135 [Stipitochalara longipes BDJ]|nr:hypothetical protein N431DRAFT_371135 [Stipitochalara longipes BDJ]
MDIGMLSSNETTYSGWTGSPNGRGTIDIILSCLFTIILCCWTTVCPNLPALTDRRLARFRDKFDLACIGLLGPEVLFGIALGQRTSARRSVKKFQNLDGICPTWTLTHAFFADMGGFVLEAADLAYPIPLDAEQIHYLVKNRYIDYPALDKDEIEDKNKSDGLARLLTACQALWFLASSIARPIQGLSMTTLELTTISFIIVMFGTSYCWFHKPSDISRPVILQCKTSIAYIRSEAGYHDPDNYQSTPLDFINQDPFVMDPIWDYYVQLLQMMRIPLFSRRISVRPHNRNRSDKFLKPELDFELFYSVIALCFSATFMCAWNFYFPSGIERILWRCASVYSLVFIAVGGSYSWLWHIKLFDKHRAAPLPSIEIDGYPRSQITVASKLTKLSPPEGIPKILFYPLTFLSVFYCLFRLYVFVEDFIGLRNVPSSAYASVNWSPYIPHI